MTNFESITYAPWQMAAWLANCMDCNRCPVLSCPIKKSGAKIIKKDCQGYLAGWLELEAKVPVHLITL